MAQRLQGKSAVVTGGGGGIGRGIALALAAEGVKVVVNDFARKSDGTSTADKVVEEITKAKGAAVANYDSVATMEGGRNIINTAISNFGRIDILVNCAGNFVPMPSYEMTEEVWDSIIAVHLKGLFSCYKAAVSQMMQQKSGRIINFSSRAAFHGPPVCVAYCVAKGGAMSFTADVSRELKPHGITVNCILPSAITPLFPNPKKPTGDYMPLPLITDPDCVAPIVVYLASDEAQNITGQFIYAAGGDVAIYNEPIQLTAAHRFIRKMGKWTVDELSDLIPPLVGLSE